MGGNRWRRLSGDWALGLPSLTTLKELFPFPSISQPLQPTSALIPLLPHLNLSPPPFCCLSPFFYRHSAYGYTRLTPTPSTDFLPPSQRETQVKPSYSCLNRAHRHPHGPGGYTVILQEAQHQFFLHCSILLIPEHCASNSLAHNASQSPCWSPASPRQPGKQTGRSRDRDTICLRDSCEDI